jgi:hypothetical protein
MCSGSKKGFGLQMHISKSCPKAVAVTVLFGYLQHEWLGIKKGGHKDHPNIE